MSRLLFSSKRQPAAEPRWVFVLHFISFLNLLKSGKQISSTILHKSVVEACVDNYTFMTQRQGAFTVNVHRNTRTVCLLVKIQKNNVLQFTKQSGITLQIMMDVHAWSASFFQISPLYQIFAESNFLGIEKNGYEDCEIIIGQCTKALYDHHLVSNVLFAD